MDLQETIGLQGATGLTEAISLLGARRLQVAMDLQGTTGFQGTSKGVTSLLWLEALRAQGIDKATPKFHILSMCLGCDYFTHPFILSGGYGTSREMSRTHLQLPLRQWGASNVYLLVLSS